MNRRITTPVATDSFVAVGDLEGYVHFIDPENGKFAARTQVGSEAIMSMIKGDSPAQVIVATRNGGLYALLVESTASSKASTVAPVTKTKIEPTETVVDEIEPETEVDELSIDTSEGVKADSEEADEAPRSILFKKDSILVPDNETENGPGIKLPRSQ